MYSNIEIPKGFADKANLNFEEYKSMYEFSLHNPTAFWAEQADRLTWFKRWTSVKETSFNSPVDIKWFSGGQLNVSYNCVDRHVGPRGDKTAIIWEADDPSKSSRIITYRKLYQEVNKFAAVLRKMGVRKGDRVLIYMPMIPETAYAMLACTRIGAVHTVVFAGFSPEAISDRLQDSEAKYVITADGGFRAGKIIPLKANVDLALLKPNIVQQVLVIRYAHLQVNMLYTRDTWYHFECIDIDSFSPPEAMESSDPMFILYTSGSTSKPKGILHSTAGYLLYASLSHYYVFDHKDDDVFWCTADVGWITGHSYLLYGPLSNGATTLMFEGVPSYPSYSRFWEVIDKHKVTVFYTAPTALRSLMREGDSFVKSSSRNSLRLLGTVGEPINPEAWLWYFQIVGEGRCPIVDTWWQTETGGVMMVTLPGTATMKPGAAGLPFFGVKPQILNAEGDILKGEGEGVLVLKDSWPGQMTSVYGNHDRFEETYFSTYKDSYFTGDGCSRDRDGYYWITGRVDDVINVSGHRIGTAEIESAFVAHHMVAEAAVVGIPHEIKGQVIYAYVTLKTGCEYSHSLRTELINWIKKEIGSFASPHAIQWAPNLPKTRSGKIMRRILRKIATKETDDMGDTSTLADSNVVHELIKFRKEIAA